MIFLDLKRYQYMKILTALQKLGDAAAAVEVDHVVVKLQTMAMVGLETLAKEETSVAAVVVVVVEATATPSCPQEWLLAKQQNLGAPLSS